jgi:hypothetical protein
VALKQAGRWPGGLRECTRKKRGGGQLRGKEGGGRASTRPGTRFGREWLVGCRWSCVARFGPKSAGNVLDEMSHAGRRPGRPLAGAVQGMQEHTCCYGPFLLTS